MWSKTQPCRSPICSSDLASGAAEMVRLLTKSPLPGEPKPEMLRRYYDGLRSGSEVVRQIKIADRIHNLREMPSGGVVFTERYLRDTVELMAVLEGTRGMELLRAEYAKAESAYLHRVLQGGGT